VTLDEVTIEYDVSGGIDTRLL